MGESENGFFDPITGLPEQVAVRWGKDGEIVDLGTLGGSFSFANAMNTLGEVTGIALNTVPDPYSFLPFGTETHGFIVAEWLTWRTWVPLGAPIVGVPTLTNAAKLSAGRT